MSRIARTSLTALCLAATIAVAVSCSRNEPAGASGGVARSTDPASWTLDVRQVPAPSGPDSSDPQLTVSDRGVILSWVEQAPSGRTSRLKFAHKTVAGWSAPIDVASGDDWFVSYADPPTVMRLTGGTLVASWLVLTDILKEASDLHLSYSTDEGKTWARPFLPHRDGTTSQHAFASLFEMPGRALGVVWLDGRGDEMSLRYTAFDANWKQSPEVALDMRVCECCQTSAVVTSDGVLAAYRDRSDTETRDIAVSRLDRGMWTTGTAVHADNWQVDYCPINGPMLSARGSQAAVAWFTVKDDLGQAYAAFSSDAGRTWGAPIRLDEGGSLGRVDIDLLDDGSAVATWVERAEGRGQFRVRRIQASGEMSAAFSVAGVSGSSSSGYPRVTRQGNELVFAWTESAVVEGGSEGTLTVHTAIARLP